MSEQNLPSTLGPAERQTVLGPPPKVSRGKCGEMETAPGTLERGAVGLSLTCVKHKRARAFGRRVQWVLWSRARPWGVQGRWGAGSCRESQ